MPLQIDQLKLAVPSYFRCPISLELMNDPVTLCTGITYDRQSIEKWLDEGHNTCPATMQTLQNQDLIPNHTLRRLIQAWCVLNRSNGVERIQTPLPPAEPHKVKSMLQEVVSNSDTRLDLLKSLKNMAKSSCRNRKCLASEGIIPVLIDLITGVLKETDLKTIQVSHEALETLVLFNLDDDSTKETLLSTRILESISWLLNKATSMGTRVNASNLLQNLCLDKSAIMKIGSTGGVIEGVITLVRESLCPSAVKSGLKTLHALCLPLRLRARIVEREAIPSIVELLPGANRSTREQAMALLSALSSCAEGRAAIMSHALAMPAIVRSMTVVSDVTTEYCVDVLWSICVHGCDEKLLQDVAKLDILKNLLMLLQMDLNFKTRQQAKDLLKLFIGIQCDSTYGNEIPC